MNVKVFTHELLSELVQKARLSIRTRQHLNIHQSFDDPCQRLFNAVGIDSYIRPHRHSLDPKTEDLIAIRGVFALVLFTDGGEIENVVRFGTEKFADGEPLAVGVELPPGVWHAVVALTVDAVLLEMKAGPFVATAAKEPAPWAPEEGTIEAGQYLQSLRAAITGSTKVS
jgi:cupin fold WbuC family metalloprotein